jgi:hypothetical protein
MVVVAAAVAAANVARAFIRGLYQDSNRARHPASGSISIMHVREALSYVCKYVAETLPYEHTRRAAGS